MFFRGFAATASIALSALCWIVVPAAAETVRFTAALSGKNEVPPITSPAGGSAEMTLDTATRTFTWNIRVQGLTGEVRSVHFHGIATAKQNAPVTARIAGRDAQPPFTGSKVLTAEQVEGLMAGRWYINVHTAKFPPGEVRGQVVRR